MITLKRLFNSKNTFELNEAIRNFENNNLDLDEIQNKLFKKLLKK